jgi:hypothetical protein
MKRCRQCGEEKAQDQFALPHGRPSNICRVCYAEDQLGISAQRPSSDRPPKIRTRYGEASGDTYALYQDLQWKTKIAAAALAERGRHELALQKRREAKREKWRDRRAIAVYLLTNLDRHVMQPVGKLFLRALAAPFQLLREMWSWLF